MPPAGTQRLSTAYHVRVQPILLTASTTRLIRHHAHMSRRQVEPDIRSLSGIPSSEIEAACLTFMSAEHARASRSRPSPSLPRTRDGSGFPFDHFPGIIRTWTGGCDFSGCWSPNLGAAIPAVAGKSAGSAAVLSGLWPLGALHRPVSTHSPKKVNPSHAESENTRADSTLFQSRNPIGKSWVGVAPLLRRYCTAHSIASN